MSLAKNKYEYDLFKAVFHGKSQKVKKLIKSGAQINFVLRLSDYIGLKYGRTPLNTALMRGYHDIVSILIEAKVNLDVPLFYEVRSFYERSEQQLLHFNNIQFLLQKGADINVEVGRCRSSVWHANMHVPFHRGLTSMLLKLGADVNKIDTRKCTPLHIASQYVRVNIQIFILFLKAGACMNVGEENALNYYLNLHYPPIEDIAMLLRAAGDKVDNTSYDGFPIRRVPKYLFPDSETKMTLKHKTRDATRDFLLNANNNINLFLTVPRLPLPTILKKYLLYDCDLYDNNSTCDFSELFPNFRMFDYLHVVKV